LSQSTRYLSQSTRYLSLSTDYCTTQDTAGPNRNRGRQDIRKYALSSLCSPDAAATYWPLPFAYGLLAPLTLWVIAPVNIRILKPTSYCPNNAAHNYDTLGCVGKGMICSRLEFQGNTNWYIHDSGPEVYYSFTMPQARHTIIFTYQHHIIAYVKLWQSALAVPLLNLWFLPLHPPPLT